MAGRFVKQPDGRFSHFSEIVDDFTHMNLSRDDAFALASGLHGTDEGPRKLRRAEDPNAAGRWEEAIETVRLIHDDARAEARVAVLRIPTPVYP